MTEEMTPRISKPLSAPGFLALTGIAAYVHELARAAGHSAHFGVHYTAADPRQAAVSVLGFGLVWGLLLGTMWLAVRAGTVTLPAGLVVGVLGGSVLGLVGRSVATGIGVVAVPVVAAGKLVWAWRTGRDAVLRHAAEHPDGRANGSLTTLRQLGAALTPPWYVVALLVAFAALWSAWLIGGWVGRIEAEARTEFDVLARDATRATVIFTRTGDIVERVLDVSPGPDGKPVNRWVPGVTIRPMPDGGITYTTVRLGRTQRSEVTQP